jgi:hypothetical protein
MLDQLGTSKLASTAACWLLALLLLLLYVLLLLKVLKLHLARQAGCSLHSHCSCATCSGIQ